MTAIEALQAAKDNPGRTGAMPTSTQKWVLVYTLNGEWHKRYALAKRQGSGLGSPVGCPVISPHLVLKEWTTVDIKP